MQDFIEILGHLRRFKSATKGMSVDELVEVKTKLERIIEDRIAAEAESRKQEAEKLEKIKNYREMLAADGIELEELTADAPVKKKGKRAPRPPKYEITDANGNQITWTGQGRMPNLFKVQVEAGRSMDDFLIK